jgi:hypothetical protein
MGPLSERHASCGGERFVAHGEDRRLRKIALGWLVLGFSWLLALALALGLRVVAWFDLERW